MRFPRPSPWLALWLAGCGPDVLPDEGPDVLDTGEAPACDAPWVVYEDWDDDGFGDADSSRETCAELPGWVRDASDCDDRDPGTFPGAIEVCDGIDRDCSGEVDDAPVDAPRWHPDRDGDGYGSAAPAEVVRACLRPGGFVSPRLGTDCDDEDPSTHPGAEDAPCDGIDQDCAGGGLPAAAQIGGWEYPSLQYALSRSDGTRPVHACAGDHPVSATLEVDLELVGVPSVEGQPVSLVAVGQERVLSVRADRLRLQGLTLMGGVADGDGGGLLADVRQLELEDVTLHANTASGRGGGAHVFIRPEDGFHATLVRVHAEGNVARTDGGALSIRLGRSGFVSVEDSTFAHNAAGRDGGGIHITTEDRTATLALTDVVGRDQHAGRRGGHLSVLGPVNAILRGRGVDLRHGSAAEGGIVALDAPIDGKVELSDCVLGEGIASSHGGLVHHSGRFTLDDTLSSCELYRGRAPEGGLMWVETGSTGHFSWTEVSLHHGEGERGAGVWLTGSATPFDATLSRVTLRDQRGAPALEVDPDFGGDTIDLAWVDGRIGPNAAGGVSAPAEVRLELLRTDVGEDNGPFDARIGATSHDWDGTVSVVCEDGGCE